MDQGEIMKTIFPKKATSTVDAINSMLDHAIMVRNIHATRWWIVHYYLQGYRRIRVSSWRNALVDISFEDEQGELEFNYEKLVDMYRIEVGRLLRINTDPVISRESFGLDSVRKAGVGHTVLTYMNSRSTIHTRHQTLARLVEMLVRFGTAGLHHYRDGTKKDIGLRTRKEVVAPWELMPVPGDVFSRDEEQGTMRHRWVTLDWSKEQPGIAEKLKGANDADLGVVELPYGVSPLTGTGGGGDSGSLGGTGSLGPASLGGTGYRDRAKERRFSHISREKKGDLLSSRDDTLVKWVELTEIWEQPESDYVIRYLGKIGDVLVIDDDYSDVDIVCPLAIARYIDIGSFYGRGYIDMNLAHQYEIEKMLANAYQNVRDYDVHGVTVIPTTAGISKEQYQKPERRKVLFAEPDHANPKAQPYRLEAQNSGDAPLKTVGMAIQMASDMSGQGELLSGGVPGRVDSAAGLGFVFETGNIGILGTSNSIGNAYVQIYASMLQAAGIEIKQGMGEIAIPAMDSRMLGVTLDLQAGTIDLTEQPFPDPWDVRIDIRERAARSPEQLKQEAGMMLESQIIGPQEFRILNEKEGLGFPVVYRTEYEQWRRAVMVKLIIFNDGETPGSVPGGIDYENPEIVLEVFQELMSSVEFLVASEEVRNVFIEARDNYMKRLTSMPDELPGLSQMESVMPQQQQQQPPQQGGAGPGAGPGPMPLRMAGTQ